MVGAVYRKNIVTNWVKISKEYTEAVKLNKELEEMLINKCNEVLNDDEKKLIELVEEDGKYFLVQDSIGTDFLRLISQVKPEITKQYEFLNNKNILGSWGGMSLLRNSFMLSSGRRISIYNYDIMEHFPISLDRIKSIIVKINTPFLFEPSSINGIKSFIDNYPDFSEIFIEKYIQLFKNLIKLDEKIKTLMTVLTNNKMSVGALKKYYKELYNLKDNNESTK